MKGELGGWDGMGWRAGERMLYLALYSGSKRDLI